VSRGGVFICYRREDSSGHALALVERLRREFGTKRVFMDLDSVAPGTDFLEQIREALRASRVVLVLIGPTWLRRDDTGATRLEDPSDYVGVEIVESLQLGIPIIPVLVQGAAMPSEDELPADIAPISRREALDITNERFDHDFRRLLGAIASVSSSRSSSRTATSPRRVFSWAFVVVVLAGIAAVGWLWLSPNDRTQSGSSSTSSPANRLLYSINLTKPSQEWPKAQVGSCAAAFSQGWYRLKMSVSHVGCAASPDLAKLRNLSNVEVRTFATLFPLSSGHAKHGIGLVGLVCRQQGTATTGNYYYGGVSPDGFAELDRVFQGSPSRLKRIRVPGLDAGHWPESLQLDCTGSTTHGPVLLRFFVDSRQVLSATDPAGLEPGTVGVFAVSRIRKALSAQFQTLVVRGTPQKTQ